MSRPSQYELDAWREIQEFRGRQASRRLEEAGKRVAEARDAAAERTSDFLEDHPRTRTAVLRGQEVVAKAGELAGSKSEGITSFAPAGWAAAASKSVQRTTGRIARAGLSPERVVAKHRKRGHNVSSLRSLRSLDLEQIDLVRGRMANWTYPGVAALSGVGAGLVISGGQITIVASAGAAAAPSVGAIAGAVVSDVAAVLALSSRVVGRTALLYGYDPEAPAEKLFIMSVVNAGTAVSAGAKTAAFKDISKLTQALTRGQTWTVLNETVLARVAGQFAKRFSVRLTKQGLGKVVPVASVAVGCAFNWATLDGVMDAAEVAYRRRFLLEKYPFLVESESLRAADGADSDTQAVDDEVISVINEITEAGGPDLE